jgi:hypothetical protein
LASFVPIKCPACGAQQTVPAKFGAFLLLSRLGSGGMGLVFHAVDRELGRHVAIKVMKRALGDNPDFIRSFKHEAQSAAALNHKNVVQIYSFGQFAGQPYIVMELMGGGALDDMVAKGPLAESRALEIHVEVTEGLNAASQVGMLHGDVKPANILFSQGGEAKVVDFGLASFIGEEHKQTGQVMGTPYYIAPEKARGKKVDFRSDIYSLGATLFHVLTGKPPFDGATPVDVVMARLKKPAPDVRTRRNDLHPATAALVARMLEAEPTMRYPSYPALLVDIRGALEASRVAQRRPGVVAAPGRIVAQQRVPALKGVPWKIILIVLLLGAALFGTVRWSIRTNQRRLQAKQAEKLRIELQLVADRGVTFIGQIEGSARRIAEAAAELTALEPKVDRLAVVVPETAMPLRDLREIVDRGKAATNDADDLRARAALTYRELLETTNVMTAQAKADALDKLSGELARRHSDLLRLKAKANANLKEATALYDEAIAKDEELRKKAEEARLRELAAEAERQRLLKIKLEEERQRPLIIQRELDSLDEARAANAPLIQRRQFEEAARSFTEIQTNLTQNESKTYHAVVLDVYRGLGRLKAFLVKSICETPYQAGWTLAGGEQRDIVAADEAGIEVALGAQARMPVGWDKLELQQILKIADHYLSANKKIDDKECASLLLGLALFCYESGDFKKAEKCIALGVTKDPALKSEAHRLMPGL